MRVLKNDFIKYSRDDDAGDEQEETGWKYIHGDVFRFPKHPSLFSAMVGTGSQLLVRGGEGTGWLETGGADAIPCCSTCVADAMEGRTVHTKQGPRASRTEPTAARTREPPRF